MTETRRLAGSVREELSKRIAVMGAGGIAGNIAGFLALADEDVTIIDHWPAHVDAINQSGLKLSGTRGEHTAHLKALHVGEAWRVGEVDILVLGVKSYDNDWCLALLGPYLNPGAIVISAQNGVNEEHLAEVVGYGRVIGCMVGFSGETVGPGHVLLTSRGGRLAMGELHGRITPRLRAIAAIFEKVVEIPLTTNIWGELWSKLVINTMSNPVAGILNVRARDLREQPGPRRASLRAAAETVQVGLALGVDIEPVTGIAAQRFVDAGEGIGLAELEAELAAGAPGMGDIYGSLPRDLQRGRKTEVDSFTGYILQKGKEAGVPTPASQIIYRMVKDIEAGRLAAGSQNLEQLLTV
jgi:2-dehydropantoate 2-reductase